LDQYKLKIDWTRLMVTFKRTGEAGQPAEHRTYVGAGQVREAVVGDVDREPTPAEMEKMKGLVAEAMQQGAFGISTARSVCPLSKRAVMCDCANWIDLASTCGIYGPAQRSSEPA